MAVPPPDGARTESRLVTEITNELLGEFPEIPAGRVIAVVVRAMADLRRIAVSPETAASADDYRRVILDLARHHLHRQ
jgi:hypothetical protein